MRPATSLGLSVLTLLLGCSSSPQAMPDGQGRGLLAYDPAPPADAKTWSRPTWQPGDRYTLLRGGVAKGSFEVLRRDEHGYLIASDSSLRTKRDLDFGILGDWTDEDAPLHLLSPVDVRYHWPIWIGKRWRCHLSDRAAGGQALPIVVDYSVEELDTVSVPAGTFQALRIVRRAHLEVAGQQVLDRTSVIWYSPDIGLEVRQITGDTAVELLEWTRAVAK